jgi:hypothetical protein
MLHHDFPNFSAFLPQLTYEAELILEAEFPSAGQEILRALWYESPHLVPILKDLKAPYTDFFNI